MRHILFSLLRWHYCKTRLTTIIKLCNGTIHLNHIITPEICGSKIPNFLGSFMFSFWFPQATFQELAFKRPYPISMRRTFEMASFPSPSEVEGSNIRCSITAIAGVHVRLYEPIERPLDHGPALIFIHGGGYFLGSAGNKLQIRRVHKHLKTSSS